MTERRLVYSSVGDRHRLHRTVRHGAGFDLAVSFYGENTRVRAELVQRASLMKDQKGGKFPNLLSLHRSCPELLPQYDAIFVVDDDLRLTAKQIVHLFDLRESVNAWIVQPSFDVGGRISHAITRRHHKTRMRYVNFIEVNAPLFRRDKLEEFLRDYDNSLVGWGVDYWYLNVLGNPDWRRYVVSDEVSCVNPRRREREIQQLQSDMERRLNWDEVRRNRGFREWKPGTLEGIARSKTALPREYVRALLMRATASAKYRGYVFD